MIPIAAWRTALIALDLWIIAHEVATPLRRRMQERRWQSDPANRSRQTGYERAYRRRNRGAVRLYPSRKRRR